MAEHTMVLREIEYTFFLYGKGSASCDLTEILSQELTRFEDHRRQKNIGSEAIKLFLKTNIERFLQADEDSKIYFLDFTASDAGIIKFSILLSAQRINFGIQRQSLDKLIKDSIGRYFEELLNRHVIADIRIHSSDNEVSDSFIPSIAAKEYTDKKNKDYFTVVVAATALLIAISTGFAWFVQQKNMKNFTEQQGLYKDKYYELFIDQQVRKAIDEKRNAELRDAYQSIQSDSLIK